MGVSCGTQGKLTVTDDDVIEKSNLSQQFLFRDWNIGQAKSTVAASAAALINPNFQIEALQNRVGAQTENVFDDVFWENLNVVINALDNLAARLYVDNRCLYFQKPLLESGTHGAKCNIQMVIPHLTENYGASGDQPEKEVLMQAVRLFPYKIDHCLTWARSEFERLLEKTPAEVNACLLNPGEYASTMSNTTEARDNLQLVFECLDKEKCETFQDCISWARLRFEDYFSNRVKQLIFSLPEDIVDRTGAPIWTAPMRFPCLLEFSVFDSSHLSFVLAGSILRAETFGISVPDWAKNPKKLAEAVDQVSIPDFHPCIPNFQPTQGFRNMSNDGAVIKELIEKIEQRRKFLPSGYTMMPIEFQMDDDTNYHMDFIVGLANMRARNYGILEVEKLKAKLIAGRIIPAIATSKTMATGLVCLELYNALKLYFNRYLFEQIKNGPNIDHGVCFMLPGSVKNSDNVRSKARNVDDSSRAIAQRLSTRKGSDMVLIPYNSGRHWVLGVLNMQTSTCYYLDSLSTSTVNLHFKQIVDAAIGLHGVQSGVKKKTKLTWVNSKCPRQPGSTECGYYVLKFMKEIVEKGVQVLENDNIGDGVEHYTDADLDEIREEWAQYVANFIFRS